AVILEVERDRPLQGAPLARQDQAWRTARILAHAPQPLYGVQEAVLQERIVLADQSVPFVGPDVGDAGQDFGLDGDPPGTGHATSACPRPVYQVGNAVKAWKI